MEIKLIGLEGIPLVKSGDDISKIIKEAILNYKIQLKLLRLDQILL